MGADVNVWIALAFDGHEHHEVARLWFDSVKGSVLFCRVTQMSFLRLLTNARVMSADVLRPLEAWVVYRKLTANQRVRFSTEPPLVEKRWMSLMTVHETSGSAWTDAYLAAFAIEAGFSIVSFDRGMRRCAALSLHLLT